MRRANKIALTMGSAALIVAGAVMAGPPGGIAYDAWKAAKDPTTGQTLIQDPSGKSLADPTAACPATFTCSGGIFGDGFVQRTLTDATGVQYFQTVITDKGVNGIPSALGFTDESYVRSGGAAGTAVNGVADRQRVTDLGVTQAGTNLVTSSELNIGWATTAGANALQLSQTLTQDAVGFSTGFTLTDVTPAAGQPGGSGVGNGLRTMALDQSILLNPSVQGATDKQAFALRQIDAGAAGSVKVGSQTTTWKAGDTINAIWVGQNMPTASGQLFAFESYGNVTTNAVPASFFSLAPPTPVQPQFWNTSVFGAAPPAL